MPVSFTPLLLPLFFLVALTVSACRGMRAFRTVCLIVVFAILLITLPFFAPGWYLMARADHDPDAAFSLARWHENHSEKLGAILLWPFAPDVEAGYQALEKAAAAGHLEATYALGVRLKYGQFVPRPASWTGSSGNVFPQPHKGQPLIDQAITRGFSPIVPEEDYYWTVFRD
jgi:uncharacterized membrane protein (GlpM family)